MKLRASQSNTLAVTIVEPGCNWKRLCLPLLRKGVDILRWQHKLVSSNFVVL